MYKNFNLTESEKEQILNLHKQKGYGKSLNEQLSDEEIPSGNETTKIGTGWNRKESDDEDKQIQLAKSAIEDAINADQEETYNEPTDFTYMNGAMKVAMSDQNNFTPYILANALSDLIDGYNQKQGEPDSDMEFARANSTELGI